MANERKRRLLSRKRLIAGWVLALAGGPVLTMILLGARDRIGLGSVLLMFLAFVVAVAAIGGTWPALVAAVGSSLLVNWYFTPPFHTLTIRHEQNVVALLVFVVVAMIVSALVSAAARRSQQAARARTEADVIARAAVALVGGEDPLEDLLALLRETFGIEAIAVLSQSSSGWRVVAHSGTPCPTTPEAADATYQLSDSSMLASIGGSLGSADEHLIAAFSAQLVAARRNHDLRQQAAAARELAEANELRTALLAGVSHDLRTPLSSIKASVTSLLQEEVSWSVEATREFLETIDTETDRLNKLVGNLLDMSRLRTGSLRLTMRDVALEEVVSGALTALGDAGRAIRSDVNEQIPIVRADSALLERALANVLDNALKHAPGAEVSVGCLPLDDTIGILVVDRGPGIPPDERTRAFEPFQRLGDAPTKSGGLGLGLAVARGFVEAMGGRLTLRDSDGGGLTVSIELERAVH